MPLNLKSTRRTFMSSLGVMAGAVTGAMANARSLFASAGPAYGAAAKISGLGASGNVYDELGVTTVINGQGTMTVLGGSLARPEVEAVMALAGQHFCNIPDLEVAAGKRIAEMLKLPDGYTALVTSGAAAAMQSGLAGGPLPECCGGDPVPMIGLQSAKAEAGGVALTMTVAPVENEAVNVANYATDPAVTITEATVDAQYNFIVHLKAAFTAGKSYKVTISNLHNMFGGGVDPNQDSATFKAV